MNKIQIINSKGHWAAGWFGKSERIECLINEVLSKSKTTTKQDEVKSDKELKNLLNQLSPDTLVWTNAYYVDLEKGGKEWLNSYVEEKKLPLIGSSAKVLSNLIQKDICQSILKENNIPIPRFDVLSTKNIERIEQFLFNTEISYPIVLKPTASCLSLGVCLVHDPLEAIEKARQIFKDFPESNLIIEEFLPNDDITCGYLELGDDILLMPVHYRYLNKPGKSNIYNFEDRLIIENKNRQRTIVSNKKITDQLKTEIPKIINTLDIRDITRIDGRLDKEGTLKYFDVNGFPGLSFKGVISDMVAVCFLFYPNHPQSKVYAALIHTIIANALLRYNLPIPESMNALNLFTLESDLVIHTKKQVSITA